MARNKSISKKLKNLASKKKRRQVHVHIDNEDYKAIRDLAKQYGVTQSKLYRLAVRALLDSVETENASYYQNL